jgi:hypothetical protein
MTRSETGAGTPLIDLTREECDTYIEREVRRGVGMSAADFVAAYQGGNVDDADPAVSDLVGLLRIGQNGNRAAT